MTFNDLQLNSSILKAIQEAGYEKPTPIQAKAIPMIRRGVDIRAAARTGTGKTAAFLLPSLERLVEPSPIEGIGPRILILVPTRELAMQVAEESKKYSKFLRRAKTVCIYGGAPYPPQRKDLMRPHEILVATPGRLMDFMEQGRVDFSRLEVFILDEADRMLDMGFIKPVEEIAAATPSSRQTLLFSATLKGAVINLSKHLLKNPEEIEIVPEKEEHNHIEQRLHNVDNVDHKHRLLDHILDDPTLNQIIIFTSTKIFADRLVDKLIGDGRAAAALHGDMNQRKRTQTIGRLRSGKIQILVATDVAARGIDVQTISHVVNFDLPNSAEDYVHRIGRTGRAGASGVALSFVSPKDRGQVKEIERYTGQKLAVHIIPGLEPKVKANENSTEVKGKRRPFKGQRPHFSRRKKFK